MDVLVEGTAPDAVALAQLLAREGHTVRVATPTEIDADPRAPDIAYLDVWTPETAPRVARLRAAGTRLSCLSDLLLQRSVIPAIGVTGTAGKSTTSAFIVQLLGAAGVAVVASTTARSGNLWATEESLAALEAKEGVHVIELTSSHLAFMRHSPQIAVVTSFWPDHLELHGSLHAYRAAKEQIVRHQEPTGCVVVNRDDPLASAFCLLSAGEEWGFSAVGEVERGAFLRKGSIVARTGGSDVDLGVAPVGVQGQAVLGAVAATIAFDVDPSALVPAIARLEPPAHRAALVGVNAGVELVDDGMAATPAKAAATLGRYPEASVVLVLGGDAVSEGLPVHASPEESELLEHALDIAASVARVVVTFGSVGQRLAAAMADRGVRAVETETLAEAIGEARRSAEGAQAIVVSPMFPVTPDDRRRVAELLRGG